MTATARPALEHALTGTNVAYSLPLPTDLRRTLAMAWLVLGVAALLAAGVFSILLVLSRTPFLQDLFPVADFFRVALVAHVDLSVLVWFLAFAGTLWSLNGTARWLPLACAAYVFVGAGALVIVLAPFFASGAAIMSNYIPVLDDRFFLRGLFLLGAGAALLTVHAMASAPRVGMRLTGAGALRFGLNAAAVATGMAMLAFAWSYVATPSALEGKAYYELLFWGGGHVLQFAYTLLMLVAWLWLASAAGLRIALTPRIVVLLFGIALGAVFLTPIIYLSHHIASVEHHRLQTWLMRFGGGLAIMPVALALGWALFRAPRMRDGARPAHAALLASMLLFAFGGVIGFLINGSNVKIPAHYHGCIVGVTLALMGLTYHLLSQLGHAVAKRRLAVAQCYLYGSGQALHILGLVWSGGYGVQRKVAGAAQVLHNAQETAGMALMGMGGLIAIVGGLLFVVVVMDALRSPRSG
jgi:hypothetical protein